MIKTFADREAQKIFYLEQSTKLPPDIKRAIMRKLSIIDAATNINDLRIPPGNHLEKLKGNRAHQHSIRINDQWRICFTWKENNAYDIEIADYHS
ncbi:MAG: type II toxin-antitoxin system RelE/ParE family toxin [Candidatus Peregrinibacteria bacterium]|nr:type II toxin-antitoxin system RelE/ParE family toxin [Candidatus Peregrinibacteria bacterium]